MRSVNNKAEFRKPLSRSANERISDGHVLRWPTGMPTFARVVCHPVKNTQELPQAWRVATVIQREREALTNMAAG